MRTGWRQCWGMVRRLAASRMHMPPLLTLASIAQRLRIQVRLVHPSLGASTSEMHLAVARHNSERYSSIKILLFLGVVLDVVGIPFSSWIARLVYDLPNSRTQEYEGPSRPHMTCIAVLTPSRIADKIGMRLSSRACFDPEAVPE